jgi:hypothetical protein
MPAYSLPKRNFGISMSLGSIRVSEQKQIKLPLFGGLLGCKINTGMTERMQRSKDGLYDTGSGDTAAW